MAMTPLRPPPVYSQMDDLEPSMVSCAATAAEDDGFYIGATQSDAEDACASEIDSDCMDDEEFERYVAQHGLDAGGAGRPAAAATTALRPSSVSPAIAASTDGRSSCSAMSSPVPHESDDEHARSLSPTFSLSSSPSMGSHTPADGSPLLLLEPHSPEPLDEHPLEGQAASHVHDDGAMGDVEGSWVPAFTQSTQPQQPPPPLQDLHLPLSQSHRIPIPKRTSSGVGSSVAGSGAAAASVHATVAASSQPVPAAASTNYSASSLAAAPPVRSASRSTSSFLAVPKPRAEDIEEYEEEQREMEQGDIEDIEEFTPSPPTQRAAAPAQTRAHAPAAPAAPLPAPASAASASAPPVARQPSFINAPFRPPRPLVKSVSAAESLSASIDLTDSPPPSPPTKTKDWADKFLTGLPTVGMAASAAAAAATTTPGTSTAAPSPFTVVRSGSLRAFSNALNSTPAAAQAPSQSHPAATSQPAVPTSSLFSRLTPPMSAGRFAANTTTSTGAAASSAAAAAAAAQEDADAVMRDLWDVPDSNTPLTAALLNESSSSRPPLARSSNAFLQPRPTPYTAPIPAASPYTAPSVSSSPWTVATKRAPPVRPGAAEAAALAERRRQEEEDAAFARSLMEQERAATSHNNHSSSSHHAASTSGPGPFHPSPSKRRKVGDQASITSFLSPSPTGDGASHGSSRPSSRPTSTDPSASAGAGIGEARDRSSSSSAQGGRGSLHTPFVKQSVAHSHSSARGRKRTLTARDLEEEDDSFALDDRDDEGEAEYGGYGYGNEHYAADSRSNSPAYARRPRAAGDSNPKTSEQPKRAMPRFVAYGGAAAATSSSSSLLKPRTHHSSKFKATRQSAAQHSVARNLAARVARAPPLPGSAQAYAAAAIAAHPVAPAADDIEMSQIAAAPPPPLQSLRASAGDESQKQLSKQELMRKIRHMHRREERNKQVKVMQVSSAATPAQRAANERRQAELQERREQKEKKARESRRLQPSLDQLHTDILTWNLRELGADGSVARGLHAKLVSIPLQFRDADEYQAIMYPLLLEECRAGIEGAIEEMRSAQLAARDGIAPPTAAASAAAASSSSAQNRVDITPITARFSPFRQSQTGHISLVETDVRLTAVDAPAVGGAAGAAAAAAAASSSSSSAAGASNGGAPSSSRDQGRQSDRNSGYQHDDLVIIWQGSSSSTVPKLFEDEEEGELDPALLATEWMHAPCALLALLQDYDNKNELNRKEALAASNEAAIAAAAAATSNNQHANRAGANNPPFRLRMFFNNHDAHSSSLKKLVLTRNNKWMMVKLQNIKTLHREYSALQSCDLLQLKDALLKPPTDAASAAAPPASSRSAALAASPGGVGGGPINPATILAGISRQLTLPLMLQQFPAHISSSFNDGQKRSIGRALMKREGFSLIQGPPGTGKTKTIVGLVNMLWLQYQAKLFLGGHPNLYRPPTAAAGAGAGAPSRQMSSASRDQLKRSSSSSSGTTKQFRLLLCAPSNAAINEIVDRLEDALVDSDGNKVPLNIVRLGAGASKQQRNGNQGGPPGRGGAASMAHLPFHERVALDNLMRAEMAAGAGVGEGSAAGSASGASGTDGSIAAQLLSTPLAILKDQATRAVAAVRLLQAETNAIHTRIKEVTLLQKQAEEDEEREAMMRDAGQLPAAAASASTPAVRKSEQYEAELRQLEDKKRAILQKKSTELRNANVLKARETAEKRTSLSPQDHIRCALLQRAHIVCTTLSGSGLEFFRNLNLTFSTVIVDESAQSSEIQTLIPLKYNVKRCILVGDPNQLSATVRSSVAVSFAYKQSLFERLQLNYPAGVELLNMQYRMHWEIARWPSQTFYEGRLQTAPELCSTLLQSGHVSLQPAASAPASSSAASSSTPKMDLRVAPYVLYDVAHGLESSGQRASLFNTAEADVAVQLFQFLRRQLAAQAPDLYRSNPAVFIRRIGLISPYQRQVAELRRRFERVLSAEEMRSLEIDSVDSYQGREKDFIIFSCVRAQAPDRAKSGIGFLAEFARLNVALTRARLGMFILAHAATVSKDRTWAALVRDARDRKRIISVPRDARQVFERSLWREPDLLREMEPCPWTKSQMEAAAERDDTTPPDEAMDGIRAAASSAPAAAAASSSGTSKRPAQPSTSVAASSKGTGGASAAAAPKRLTPPSTAAGPSTGSASNGSSSSKPAPSSSLSVSAGPASSSNAAGAPLEPGILAIATVMKKIAPKGESALFANEQRTGIKRPPVPMPLPPPTSALRPLGSKHTPPTTPTSVMKPLRPAAGGSVAAKPSGSAATPASAPRPIRPPSSSVAPVSVSAAAAAAAAAAASAGIKSARSPIPIGRPIAIPRPSTSGSSGSSSSAGAAGGASSIAAAKRVAAPPPPVLSAAASSTASGKASGSGASSSSRAPPVALPQQQRQPARPPAVAVRSKRPRAEKEEGEVSGSSSSSSDSDSDSDNELLLPPRQGSKGPTTPRTPIANSASAGRATAPPPRPSAHVSADAHHRTTPHASSTRTNGSSSGSSGSSNSSNSNDRYRHSSSHDRADGRNSTSSSNRSSAYSPARPSSHSTSHSSAHLSSSSSSHTHSASHSSSRPSSRR